MVPQAVSRVCLHKQHLLSAILLATQHLLWRFASWAQPPSLISPC